MSVDKFVDSFNKVSNDPTKYLYRKSKQGEYIVAGKGQKPKGCKRVHTKEIVKIAQKAIKDTETDKAALRKALSSYKTRVSTSIQKRWWYRIVSCFYPVEKMLLPVQRLIDQLNPVSSTSDGGPVQPEVQSKKKEKILSSFLTGKMWKNTLQSTFGVMEEFTPLTEAELETLLAKQSELQKMLGNKNSRGRGGCCQAPVIDHIKLFHQYGHAVLRGESNELFKKQFQLILYKINQEKDPEKQKRELLELAYQLGDCAALTIERVGKKAGSLCSSGSGIEIQFGRFIAAAKDRAFEKAMEEVCPWVKDESRKNVPAEKQHPHLKSAFLQVFGEKYGMDMAAASSDHHAHYRISERERDVFAKAFERIVADSLVKELVLEINTRIGHPSKSISNRAFFDYLGSIPKFHKHLYEYTWDEEAVYPDYLSSKEEPKPVQEGVIPAFITENFAQIALAHFGFCQGPQQASETLSAIDLEKRTRAGHALYRELKASHTKPAVFYALSEKQIAHVAGYAITQKPDGKKYLVVKEKNGRKTEVPGGYGKDTAYPFVYMLQALRSEMWHEGNLVMTKKKTASISPPVLTMTERGKVAMLQVFHLNYDPSWEEALTCHEDSSWTIRLLPMEGLQKSKDAFSRDVWESFVLLRDNGYLDQDKEYESDTVQFLHRNSGTIDFFKGIYDLEKLNHKDMTQIRKIARMKDEEAPLLPLSENEELSKDFLGTESLFDSY